MKFEIIDAKSKLHRLTISPTEERVTVKIAVEASPEERDRVVAFCRGIYNWIGFSWPGTMRGCIDIGSSSILLSNDSGSMKKMFNQYGNGIAVKEG